MAQYALIRDGLTDIINKISQTGTDHSRKRLDELSEKLKQGQFNLVIMGQFKRGKSTLINALLGAEVVPTAIRDYIDLVEEKDMTEALDFTGEIIRKHLERTFDIYPVSSRIKLIQYRQQAETL